ncbi:MAG: NAD(P)(+) transhydrogenase (Re/Si-specific) subunit beta [Piscirickettsiaceae bacterium]|nr:NAD(P)(+) transhydrogenase (Re/Si-specific) subunit beta [Piscirickettsiaceae bacterium]
MLDFEEQASGEGGYATTMTKEFLDAEMALFARQSMEVDIIISTALIPGNPAPKLITEGMVKTMNLGSVIAGDFQSIDVNETVPMLRDADNIMIIPGYGMAVAQAQHTINEITQ